MPLGKAATPYHPQTRGVERDAIEAALDGLDSGELRVAEKAGGGWRSING